MNSKTWEQQLMKEMSNYPYTRKDFIQDAWMFTGGILILIYWIFQVMMNMKGLAGI